MSKSNRCITLAAAAIFGVLLVNFPAAGQDAHLEGFRDGLARGAVDAPYVAAFLFGLLGGPFYLLYTLFTEPTIPPEVLVAIQDRPREYQMGYLEGYKHARQTVRVIGGLIGTGVWFVAGPLAAALDGGYLLLLLLSAKCMLSVCESVSVDLFIRACAPEAELLSASISADGSGTNPSLIKTYKK